jgi:RNA polymerase sigma-70 factor (ECF subfamily)
MVGEHQPWRITGDGPPSFSGAAPSPQDALADGVAAIARGDERSLASLFDATGGLVYALAERILRDAREAEETLVEVFHYVWQRAARYDASRGPVETWLMVITRGRALDRLRARAARARHEEDTELDSALATLADPAASVEAELVAAERSDALGRALARLSERERRVIELAFFLGRTHEEIARETGLPLGTIKSQIRRGLEKLHTLLLTLEAER